VNLSGSYTWGFLTVFGRVENVLDEDYEEAGGFGTPGVSAFGGVKLVF
jgi:vitamin B12 transporter